MNDINLTHADCLKHVNEIGLTRVYNICTGAVTDVPWGSADWLGALAIGVMVAGAGLMFIGMGITIIRDRF